MEIRIRILAISLIPFVKVYYFITA